MGQVCGTDRLLVLCAKGDEAGERMSDSPRVIGGSCCSAPAAARLQLKVNTRDTDPRTAGTPMTFLRKAENVFVF